VILLFKKILDVIIDIETVGIFSPQANRGDKGVLLHNAIFNVGITIQHKGNVISSEQICIRDIWQYPEHRIMDFYRKNFTEKDFETDYESFDEFYKQHFIPMLKNINKLGQKARLWSFNAQFDRDGFIANTRLYEISMPLSIMANWFCIMVLASSIFNTNRSKKKKYINFLLKNEYEKRDGSFVTVKGNFKASAESMYRYISNDPTFIEAHKGKQDTLIEGKILEWCKKEKGWSKLPKIPIGGAWTILNKNARPFQSLSSVLADQKEAEVANCAYPWYVQPSTIEAYEWVLERAESYYKD
jgi:hypothetical protein